MPIKNSSAAAAPPGLEAKNYELHIVNGIKAVQAEVWNALLPAAPGHTFIRHEWLNALEVSGSVTKNTGWQPLHVMLRAEGAKSDEPALAAMPLYLKYHSYGEYVFDWAWANAYERSGLSYYPKLLCAAPFTPVTGPRMLGDLRLAPALLQGLESIVASQNLSSAHVLFPPQSLALNELSSSGAWMQRRGVQFHWNNEAPAKEGTDIGTGEKFKDFEDFLSSLSQPKRKKIRAERRKAQEAGITCRWVEGRDITESDWTHFIRCYNQTYREHQSTPYLKREFFLQAHQAMAESFVLIIARHNGEDVAASLLIRETEAGGDRLFGRYWGALTHVPFMHFEVAYYQSIEYAITRGCKVLEGGAQGEHKMARGFLPVATQSWHFLKDTRFADAVENFLTREGEQMQGYMDELNERNPFK